MSRDDAITNNNSVGELIRKPFLSGVSAAELLRCLYGLEATRVEELPSYSDQNFYARVTGAWAPEDGRQVVLKVINSEDSLHQAGCYEEIAAVLAFLQTRPDGAMYPAPVTNRHGEYLSIQKFYRDDGAYGVFMVLLLSFVPGIVLTDVPLTNRVLFGVGKAAATLNRKLMEFKGETKHLQERGQTDKWCLAGVAKVRQFLDRVPDVNRRQLAVSVLDRFARDVKPLEQDMQKGIIHADVNRSNVLVTPMLESTNEKPIWTDDAPAFGQSAAASHEVSGIIDFNDMVHGCLVYDIAGSLMDVMVGRRAAQPLAAAGHFLAGYAAAVPLSTAERRSVYVATAARLVQILVLSHEYSHRAGDSPDPHVMRIVHAGGWEVLDELWATPQHEVEAIWEELSTNTA